MRAALVVVHRWVGLVMAGFLLIAGLTGSLLAFNEALEATLSPTLFRVQAPPGAQPLDPLVLRAMVAARYPEARVTHVKLTTAPADPSSSCSSTGSARRPNCPTTRCSSTRTAARCLANASGAICRRASGI